MELGEELLFSEALEDGWHAFYNGLERSDNPHEPLTWDYESWDYGWINAMEDYYDEWS